MRQRTTIIIAIIIGLVFIGAIAYSIYTAISRSGKEPVEVYILPPEATVTVNGQKITAGTQYLAPGTYEIEAKSEGFADSKESVTIGKPNKEFIDIGLTPVSDKAKEWAAKNNNLYLAREGRGGERARERGEAFKNLNPITRHLPINTILYTIGYTLDPSDPSGNSIILQVNAPQGYREGVLGKIRELGYDPTNFKINFKVYESPFGNE